MNLQKLVIFRSNMAKRKTKKVAGKKVNADAGGDLLASASGYTTSAGNYPASASNLPSSAGDCLASACDLPASANAVALKSLRPHR